MPGNPTLFYHETVPALTCVATAVGITMAGFIAGQTASVSYQTTPALLEAPAPVLVKQWKKLFDIGFKVAIPSYAICTAIFSWLASQEPRSSPAFKFYVAAALLIPSNIPFTRIFVLPINNKLFEKDRSLASVSLTDAAAEAGVSKEETVHALVDKWATVNLGRVLITTTGALCAAYAAISKIDVRALSSVALSGGADRLG
ncbi:MAG: hypothetical protein M1820_007112 [Bogoriella megaspora]|nr:MAG: hypothetical protein M1820_007112 [Bogoriella megaspora]